MNDIPGEKRVHFRGQMCDLFWGSEERMSAQSAWLNSQPKDATFSSDSEGYITCNGKRCPGGYLYFGATNWASEVADWLNTVQRETT